jgi:hypothetical protein
MAENTSFSMVFSSFLTKVTDDMYMELFEEETNEILSDILIDAIHWFEFPKVDISDYDLEEQFFNVPLSQEEINILATYMVVEWVGQQIASVENTRMKYSGSDFKFTSQANHLAKLLALRSSYEKQGLHMQRLYKRRSKTDEGKTISTFSQIMERD